MNGQAAWAQHTAHFVSGPLDILDVLQHGARNEHVDLGLSKRQFLGDISDICRVDRGVRSQLLG